MQSIVAVADAPLSRAELAELQRLEGIVSDWRRQYRAVGGALRRLQDLRLWRGQAKSWQEYCEQRFDLAHTSILRYQVAADVASVLEKAGLPLPTSATVAAELACLDDGQIIAVWEAALKDAGKGRVTVKIAHAAKLRLSPEAAIHGDGTIDSDLAELLHALPPERQQEIVQQSEAKARAAAADDHDDVCPWLAVLRSIRQRLKRLDATKHGDVIWRITTKLQEIATLLENAA
jgi:hypothetical protein